MLLLAVESDVGSVLPRVRELPEDRAIELPTEAMVPLKLRLPLLAERLIEPPLEPLGPGTPVEMEPERLIELLLWM